MIIIVTGAPGSGKTKTVRALMESTLNSAAIDGDAFLGINPFSRTMEERLLQYKNIASVAKNYYENGYKTIFISFVYTQTQLKMQIELLEPIDKVEIFVLVPNEKTLRDRHANDSYSREAIEPSLELNNKMAELEDVHIIDNSDMTIELVVMQIKKMTDLS
jgi:adenylylsulfate kinase-like enzyme